MIAQLMTLSGKILVTQDSMSHLRLDLASQSLTQTGPLPHQLEDARLLQVKPVGRLRKDSLFYRNTESAPNKPSLILLGLQGLPFKQPGVNYSGEKARWITLGWKRHDEIILAGWYHAASFPNGTKTLTFSCSRLCQTMTFALGIT